MLNSADYVLRTTTNPVIDYYNRNKYNPEINAQYMDEIKKLYGNASNARTVVSNFKKTGDLYKYLKSIVNGNKESTAASFRKYGFIPFEDIIDEFEDKFRLELSNFTKLNELELDKNYSTWDVIFLANIYRAQSFGIQTVKDENQNVRAVVVRGTFDSSMNNYANKWINDNELLYHLIGENSNSNNINNDHLISGKFPIYIFETVGSNQHIFKGVFKFQDYYKKTHTARLTRIEYKPDETNKPLVSHQKYSLPTTETFIKQVDKRDSLTAGTHKTLENKKRSGQKAENYVLGFLLDKGFSASDVANKAEYHYDIHINDLDIGLEVKNIVNGYFYISENEIRQLEKNATRLCFVDDDNILISKKYSEVKLLVRIFDDLRSIDGYVIDKYKGVYQVSDIKIGIDIASAEVLIFDFTKIDNMTIEDIKRLF